MRGKAEVSGVSAGASKVAAISASPSHRSPCALATPETDTEELAVHPSPAAPPPRAEEGCRLLLGSYRLLFF